ncbi:MAG: TIGR02530 family flagellar biosynthesis protein [Candidatus Lernaella stagnicola]|nr:TIGR02530 family flagellar biosynthesis protein [Candidatus Lernaella stagnicola]
MDKVISASFYVPQAVGKPTAPSASTPAAKLPSDDQFRAVLDRQIQRGNEVRFSAHARERLAARNVNLNSAEVGKINQAVESVAAKGGRNTLVVGADYALIVSIPNRTVITALPRGGMQENVITNIDSTVFVE